MFVPNQRHRQKPLFSTVKTLPEKQRKRLEESWAGTFYREVFCRMEERTFEVLYSEKASRPNVPVNVLMGLEILKDGNGWTDAEMHENFSYNLQVRYALGYESVDEGHFELRTVYNFRKRLVEHMEKTGENLVEECFEQITDEQLEAYAVKSGVQRTDSKQVMSNIRERTRLQLLVEIVQRTHRMLDVVDKQAYAEQLEPYIKEQSHKYTYRLKGEKHKPHIKAVGEVMGKLVVALADKYGTQEEYKLLKRVFEEHFKEEEGTVEAKEGAELAADTLQSPDDVEATYRSKRGKGQSGYVVNVTETVDDEGGLNLITKVQTAPNVTDDAQLLNEALPDLVARTGVAKMWGDGTYGSPEVDETCRQHGVELHQTGIRGATPDPEKLTLADCTFDLDEDGHPQLMTCPHRHPLDLAAGRKEGRYVARLTESNCPQCAAQHGTTNRAGHTAVVLYFSLANMMLALRRQRLSAARLSDRNPRSAVEAAVRELTCRLDSGRLRVRGLSRVSMTLLASAAMCNARRIWRFQQRQSHDQNHTLVAQNTQNSAHLPLFPRFWLRRTRHRFDCPCWHGIFDLFEARLFSFSL